MRIGYCCGYSEETVKYAAKVGFTTLEIGYHANESDWPKMRQVFDANGMLPMTVFHYDDYAKGEHVAKDCIKAMDQCKAMGAPVLAVNAFVPHPASVKDKLAFYKKTFGLFAKEAAARGLRVAIENCPHGLHNIGYSPVMWDAMFNEVDPSIIGLEFDPSHLVWLGVDYVAALKKYAKYTYAFHAKDTEVFEDVLAVQSIEGHGWWRYRIPGWGEVEWEKLFTILWENDYKGDITIEHEDPVFEGPRMKEGLERGLTFLQGLVGHW